MMVACPMCEGGTLNVSLMLRPSVDDTRFSRYSKGCLLCGGCSLVCVEVSSAYLLLVAESSRAIHALIDLCAVKQLAGMLPSSTRRRTARIMRIQGYRERIDILSYDVDFSSRNFLR